jgi:hypothetical protein
MNLLVAAQNTNKKTKLPLHTRCHLITRKKDRKSILGMWNFKLTGRIVELSIRKELSKRPLASGALMRMRHYLMGIHYSNANKTGRNLYSNVILLILSFVNMIFVNMIVCHN